MRKTPILNYTISCKTAPATAGNHDLIECSVLWKEVIADLCNKGLCADQCHHMISRIWINQSWCRSLHKNWWTSSWFPCCINIRSISSLKTSQRSATFLVITSVSFSSSSWQLSLMWFDFEALRRPRHIFKKEIKMVLLSLLKSVDGLRLVFTTYYLVETYHTPH